MEKIKCVNCGFHNFEKVSVCPNCRKLVSQSKNLPSQIKSSKSQSNISKNENIKIILSIILIAGFIVAGKFGYGKYAEWQQEKLEIEEVKKFQWHAFRNNEQEIKLAQKEKLPTRFNFLPPDINFVNTFPFKERLFRKGKGGIIGKETFTSPSVYSPGQIVGTTGNAVHTSGGWSGGGTSTRVSYGAPSEIRVIEAVSVDGYRYYKGMSDRLIVEVRFVVKYEERRGWGADSPCSMQSWENGTKTGEECVASLSAETMAIMKVQRSGDSWEVISVEIEKRGSGHTDIPIKPWYKGDEIITIEDSFFDKQPTRIQSHSPMRAEFPFVDAEKFYKMKPENIVETK